MISSIALKSLSFILDHVDYEVANHFLTILCYLCSIWHQFQIQSKNHHLESHHICRYLTQIWGLFLVQHSYFCQVQAILNCTLPLLLTIGKNLFTILLWNIWHGLHFLGKHFLLTRVVVDPESHKIFSNLLHLTEEMVSTTMIITGVRFWETFFLGLSTSLSLPLFSDMAYTSSVHVSNMDDSFSNFGAFLVEPRLKFALQWSVFVKLDNCLLRVNLDSYRTISRYFVLQVLSLGFY